MVIVVSDKTTAAVALKHNYLVEAGYSLTLQEKRVLLFVLSQIRPDFTDTDNIFRVGVKTYAKVAGLKNNNLYKDIMELKYRFMSRPPFPIREIEDKAGKKKDTLTQWVASCEYFHGEGVIEIEIPRKLMPYLIGLSQQYTVVLLKYAFALRSFYAIRLYELLKQYQNMSGDKKEKSRFFTVSDLKEKLGIGQDEYTKFSHFKFRVIDAIVADVSLNTDLDVWYQTEKTGRAVTGVRFYFKIKTEKQITIVDENEEFGIDQRLFTRLCGVGFSEKEARRLILTYQGDDPERVSWHLDEMERQKQAGTIKKTPLAFMRWAVKEDLREQRSLFSAASGKASNAIASEKERIKGSMARLTTDEKEACRQEFEREIKAGNLGKLQQSRFEISAWNSETTKRAWLKFMAGKLGIECSAL